MTDPLTQPTADSTASDVTTVDPAGPDLRQEYLALMRACTPKQRKWLRVVAEMAGQTSAAIEKLKYSRHTCWKWLRLPHIQRVLALQEQIAEIDSEVTKARTRREYGRLAYSTLGLFYNGPTLKPVSEWTEDMFAAVKELEFDATGGIVKLKLHDKARTLDAVAKMQKLLVERHAHEHSAPGGGPIEHAVKAKHALTQTTDPNDAMAVYSELVAGEPEKG